MPYAIATPIGGQPVSAGAFGVPVKLAIDDIDDRISALETGSQAFIARARRTTSTGNVTTTETGVLRIDNVLVKSGSIIQVQTGPLNLDTDVAETVATARLRVAYSATTGTAATTSSGMIGQYRANQENATQSNVGTFNGFYIVSADGYISVLLSILRQAGSGNIVCFSDSTNPTDLVVQYGGADPGDTGVVI